MTTADKIAALPEMNTVLACQRSDCLVTIVPASALRARLSLALEVLEATEARLCDPTEGEDARLILEAMKELR